MEIKQFIETYPEAKQNPLKYSVESIMKSKNWWKGNEREDIENSILLQDFVEEVNDLVDLIKNYENNHRSSNNDVGGDIQ